MGASLRVKGRKGWGGLQYTGVGLGAHREYASFSVALSSCSKTKSQSCWLTAHLRHHITSVAESEVPEQYSRAPRRRSGAGGGRVDPGSKFWGAVGCKRDEGRGLQGRASDARAVNLA